MANTEIGEIGLTTADRTVVLRPSLRAMAKLGDGEGLVQLYDRLHRDFAGHKRAQHGQFLDAVGVLHACTDEDIFELTGHHGQRWNSWVAGRITPRLAVLLARSLISHGVTGVVPEDERYEPDLSEGKATHTTEFHPREVASMAMAHLGYSEAEAWNLTVTSFTLAMRAKFPPPERKTPTRKEYSSTMDWLAAINEGR